MTAAATATKHLNDNRSVVCGKDDTGAGIVILPTTAVGQPFWPEKVGGTASADAPIVATATVPAYCPKTDTVQVTVKVDFATTAATPGGVTSKYVRKQFFKANTGDPSTGKWCYTSIKGQPLAADGTVTTVALAADATKVALTAQGLAVGNYAQPGPMPGTYTVSTNQQGSAPHLGWTVKQTAKV
jgi:hypothetical protein